MALAIIDYNEGSCWYTKVGAERDARINQEDDAADPGSDNWSYIVVPHGQLWKIEIRDEDGYKLGYL